MDGWNSRDAHALAMLFTEDGDYTTVGGSNTHGRKDMEEMFVRLLTTGQFRTSHRTDTVKRIRFLAPGVASVDDYWSVEGMLERPPLEGLYAWVMVKQDGHWLTPFTTPPTLRRRLRPQLAAAGSSRALGDSRPSFAESVSGLVNP